MDDYLKLVGVEYMLLQRKANNNRSPIKNHAGALDARSKLLHVHFTTILMDFRTEFGGAGWIDNNDIRAGSTSRGRETTVENTRECVNHLKSPFSVTIGPRVHTVVSLFLVFR